MGMVIGLQAYPGLILVEVVDPGLLQVLVQHVTLRGGVGDGLHCARVAGPVGDVGGSFLGPLLLAGLQKVSVIHDGERVRAAGNQIAHARFDKGR